MSQTIVLYSYQTSSVTAALSCSQSTDVYVMLVTLSVREGEEEHSLQSVMFFPHFYLTFCLTELWRYEASS